MTTAPMGTAQENSPVRQKIPKVLSPSRRIDRKPMENEQETAARWDNEKAPYCKAGKKAVAEIVALALRLEGDPEASAKSAEAEKAGHILARLSWRRRPEERLERAALVAEAERLYFLRAGEEWDALAGAVWRGRPDLGALRSAALAEISERMSRGAVAVRLEAELERNLQIERIRAVIAALVKRGVDDSVRGAALCRALCSPPWKRALSEVARDEKALESASLDGTEIRQIVRGVNDVFVYAELIDLREDGLSRLARVAKEAASAPDPGNREDVLPWEISDDDPRLGHGLVDDRDPDPEEERRDELEEQMRGELFPIFRAVRRKMIKRNAKFAKIIDEMGRGARPSGRDPQDARMMRSEYLSEHGILRAEPLTDGSRLGSRHVVPNGLGECVPEMKEELKRFKRREQQLQESCTQARKDAALWSAVDEELAAIRDIRRRTREMLAADHFRPLYEVGLVKAPKGIPDILSKREPSGRERDRDEPVAHAFEPGRVILASRLICVPIEATPTIDLLRRERQGRGGAEIDRISAALKGKGTGQWLYFRMGGVGV